VLQQQQQQGKGAPPPLLPQVLLLMLLQMLLLLGRPLATGVALPLLTPVPPPGTKVVPQLLQLDHQSPVGQPLRA
jgi:hypothetical protein